MHNGNERAEPSAQTDRRTARIPFKIPYDWEMIIRFLGPRAIPGLEMITAESYKRVIDTEHSGTVLEVRPSPRANYLTINLPDLGQWDRERVLLRLSRLFDCTADPGPITDHLCRQSLLRDFVRMHPGIRVPGAFDGFEIAVRAVLGQQITVRAATTMAGRLVAAFGTQIAKPGLDKLTYLFPAPAIFAEADLTRIGLTRGKAAAIAGLARRCLSEPSLFEPSDNPDAAISKLVGIPGIGEWTAQYIAMRALKHADAFPASDLGLRRALSANGQLVSPKEVEEQAKAWRPWRAYAAMHLWASLV